MAEDMVNNGDKKEEEDIINSNESFIRNWYSLKKRKQEKMNLENIKENAEEKEEITKPIKKDIWTDEGKIKPETRDYLVNELSLFLDHVNKDYINEDTEEKPLFDMSVEETMEKIKKDPIWFIESYCKIDGDKPFILFTYQKEFINKALENKYLIVNKARQLGISQVAGAFLMWYAMTKPKKEIVVISLNNSEAEYFVDRRIFQVYDSLPKFIKGKLKKNSADIMEFENGSKIEAMANTKKALRGRSSSIVFVDEMAFQTQAQDMITSAMPSIQLGEHLILVSTPNGTTDTGEFFYKTWEKAVKKESDFYPLEIHWYESPLYNDEAPKKVDWKTNKWAMTQYKNYTNPDSFKQEILGEFVNVTPEEQEKTNDKGPMTMKPYMPPEFVKKFWREYIKD